MNLDEVVRFIGSLSLGVVATIGPDNQPQAALVGIAVTDECELVFDTVESTRKVQNLRRDPRISVVIGGTMDDERTVQCDGVADAPDGAELDRIRAVYFARYPDGRDRLGWEGITHVRIRPRWLRYSDFNRSPALIVEALADESGELVFG